MLLVTMGLIQFSVMAALAAEGKTMEGLNVGTIVSVILLVVCGLVALSFMLSSLVTTEQNTKRVIERFGKFVGVRSAGISLKLGWIDKAKDPISLRTLPLEVTELAYTSSGNSVSITAQVQYKVDESDESVKAATYKLQNAEAQIQSHVSNAIRSKVPTMTLEQVQTNQPEIKAYVKDELTETMRQYGYVIEDVLIVRADPDETVVKANNEKYASQQQKQTATNLAEAQYTQTVRAAEADRDAMKAHGEGIALEREAITTGLEKSIETLRDAVPGATAQDVLALVAYQQYVDAQVKIAGSADTKVIFLNGNADASATILESLRQTLISSAEASREPKSHS